MSLTLREWDVLRLLYQGLFDKEIAAKLNITLRTAKFHLSSIYAKLGVNGRHDLLAVEVVLKPRILPQIKIPRAIVENSK